MLERNHSFEIRDKSYDDVQGIMENVLKKNLSLSINSKRLGNSLLRINYFDNNLEKEQQKDNRITITASGGAANANLPPNPTDSRKFWSHTKATTRICDWCKVSVFIVIVPYS